MMRLSLGLFTTLTVGCLCAVLLSTSLGHALPQEDEIVYSANLDNTDFEIYRMALDRQLSVVLTRNSAEDSQPAWSADGQRIAFVSNSQGQ